MYGLLVSGSSAALFCNFYSNLSNSAQRLQLAGQTWSHLYVDRLPRTLSHGLQRCQWRYPPLRASYRSRGAICLGSVGGSLRSSRLARARKCGSSATDFRWKEDCARMDSNQNCSTPQRNVMRESILGRSILSTIGSFCIPRASLKNAIIDHVGQYR
jgi:hypothetical protein